MQWRLVLTRGGTFKLYRYGRLAAECAADVPLVYYTMRDEDYAELN